MSKFNSGGPLAESGVRENSSRCAASEFLQGIALTNVFFLFALVAIGTALFISRNHLNSWVLPVAACVTLAGIFVFRTSWIQAAALAVTFVASHLVAYAIAGYFLDGSWDGLAYHQQAILNLAAGWNPFFESAGTYSKWHEVWNDHFPKASWIGGTVVFLFTGRIEPGKLFHYTLMLTAGCQVAATLLRLTRLKALPVIVIAALATLNPVCIYQSSSFYVDGLMSSLFTTIVATLVLYVFAPNWRALLSALFSICLMINLKFTGLLYAVLLLGAGVLAVWYVRDFRSAVRLASVSAITGAISVLVIGYSPYVRNLHEHGNIFYPMYGRDVVDYTSTMRPANIVSKDRVSRFFIANLSRSEFAHPPDSTQLKIPFRIASREKSAWGLPDPEAGAFGPLYGGLLLVTIVMSVLLMVFPSTRRMALVPLLIAAFLFLTVFSHSEGWWGRYAPQAWLLPLLVALACWQIGRSWQWFGTVIIVLASLNMLYVGYFFARHEWGYTREIRRSLQEMARADKPVKIYLGTFRSLGERLREHHVTFQITETQPPAESVSSGEWHPIAPAQAYWSVPD